MKQSGRVQQRPGSSTPVRKDRGGPVYETESLDRSTEASDGRLLLVEDDDGDAFLVEELLLMAGSGFEIARARTLEEARRLVRAQSFGCVLLDLGLPDGQGLQVVR